MTIEAMPMKTLVRLINLVKMRMSLRTPRIKTTSLRRNVGQYERIKARDATVLRAFSHKSICRQNPTHHVDADAWSRRRDAEIIKVKRVGAHILPGLVSRLSSQHSIQL